MKIERLKDFKTKNGFDAVVCFKLEIGGGWVGLVNGNYGMARWWTDEGVDHINRDYDLVLEG